MSEMDRGKRERDEMGSPDQWRLRLGKILMLQCCSAAVSA